jgi:hypothetical protein
VPALVEEALRLALGWWAEIHAFFCLFIRNMITQMK